MPDERIGYWHLFHDELGTFLIAPIQARIEHIRAEKPEHEIETRLRLLKPMSREAMEELRRYGSKMKSVFSSLNAADYVAMIKLACEPLEKLHRIECPDCPWDGETIFPKRQEKTDA